MKCPPHGPDLAPSDCHLFGSIPDTLRSQHFTSGQEVTEAVHTWLVTEPNFFPEGTQKLVDI
jgi:hypothetical protein